MAISIDQTKATIILNDSLRRTETDPAIACNIKPAIDFILHGKNCLTYRYILFTALVAKATNNDIDIMSLQASDDAAGSYDARSFCKNVIFPFQREFLDDVLDGSNEDPLVNNPGRHPRIQVTNKSANGDPRRALDLLCEYLPLVKTSEEAQCCLDYFITCCREIAAAQKEQAAAYEVAIMTSDIFAARSFMNELLDKNFGGAALLIVASSVFSIMFPLQEGYKVVPHPVNQSGASSKQMSDLDIFNADGSPFLAIELKDKPFTETEVKKAAQTAFAAGAPSLLFVAGRASALTEETYRYFNEAKAGFEQKGMVIGIVTIDALLDLFFTTQYRAASDMVFDLMRMTMEDAHVSPEAMRWFFKTVDEL